MEIAFHIGANCTDEDRLLKSILKNGDVLRAHGVKAPGPGKYRRLIRETIQNLGGMPPAENTRQILLDAIVDGEQPQRLVMANPNFICIENRVFDNSVFYQQAAFKVQGLMQLFPNDQVELHLALRNPATFLPDVFAKSKRADFHDYMQGMPPENIRWSEVVRRIREAAPNARLTVWCNEDTPLIWAELIRELTGLDQMTRITGGFDLLASIMAPEGMNRFLNYLRAHPPENEQQKRRVIAAFLDKYAIDDAVEETVDLPGMTGEMVDYLTDVYDQDVAYIAQMPDVDFIAP